MLKLKRQYFGHLMQRTDSSERTWCWEWLKVGGEGDDRRWDDWMAFTYLMDMSLSKLWELVDREAWHAAVHGVANSQTRLSNWTVSEWESPKYLPCKVPRSMAPDCISKCVISRLVSPLPLCTSHTGFFNLLSIPQAHPCLRAAHWQSLLEICLRRQHGFPLSSFIPSFSPCFDCVMVFFTSDSLIDFNLFLVCPLFL